METDNVSTGSEKLSSGYHRSFDDETLEKIELARKRASMYGASLQAARERELQSLQQLEEEKKNSILTSEVNNAKVEELERELSHSIDALRGEAYLRKSYENELKFRQEGNPSVVSSVIDMRKSEKLPRSVELSSSGDGRVHRDFNNFTTSADDGLSSRFRSNDTSSLQGINGVESSTVYEILRHTQDENKRLTKELSSKRADYETLVRELSTLQEHLKKSSLQYEKLSNEFNEANGKLQFRTTQVLDGEREREKAMKREVDLQNSIYSLESQVKLQKSELAISNSELKTSLARVKLLEKQLQEYQSMEDSRRRSDEVVLTEKNEKTKRLLEEQENRHEMEINQMKQEINTLQKSCVLSATLLAERDQIIQEHTSKLKEYEGKCSIHVMEVHNYETQLQDAKDKISLLERTLASTIEHASMMERVRQSSQETESVASSIRRSSSTTTTTNSTTIDAAVDSHSIEDNHDPPLLIHDSPEVPSDDDDDDSFLESSSPLLADRLLSPTPISSIPSPVIITTGSSTSMASLVGSSRPSKEARIISIPHKIDHERVGATVSSMKSKSMEREPLPSSSRGSSRSLAAKDVTTVRKNEHSSKTTSSHLGNKPGKLSHSNPVEKAVSHRNENSQSISNQTTAKKAKSKSVSNGSKSLKSLSSSTSIPSPAQEILDGTRDNICPSNISVQSLGSLSSYEDRESIPITTSNKRHTTNSSNVKSASSTGPSKSAKTSNASTSKTKYSSASTRSSASTSAATSSSKHPTTPKFKMDSRKGK